MISGRVKEGASGHHTKLPRTSKGSEYKHMDEVTLEFERLREWEALGDRLYAAHVELLHAGILAGKLCGNSSREARAVERMVRELNATRNIFEDRVVAEGFWNPPTSSPIRGGAVRCADQLKCAECAV